MEIKQKKATLIVSVLAIVGLVWLCPIAVAGNLEPSAAPGPTMKTLDEVEPRIPIHVSDLPLTITEPNSYYLVEDVNFTDDANHTITIECNDVTIDLMGYTLKGPDSGTKYGIYMDGRSNVEVRNGTVRDFYRGIYESSLGKQHRVINVRVMSNGDTGIQLHGTGNLVKDCTAAQNGSSGIYASNGSTITGNTAYQNSLTGISGSSGCTVTGNTTYNNGALGIYANTCTVTGNTAYNNSSCGIYSESGSTVTGNTAYQNGSTGIFASTGCTVTGNTAYNNGSHGISAGNNCTVTGNTATSNTRDGIRVEGYCKVIDNTCDLNGNYGSGAGIHTMSNQNRIEQNHVTNNDRGIEVEGFGNLIVKNSAAGNTTDYSIVGGNKVGISADPTTAGPWDNLDL